jgi:outer membrane lipoprotein-sorting protein
MHPRFRIPLLLIALLSLPIATATSQQPPPLINPVGTNAASDAPLTPDASLDTILDALDARGKTLKDFSADVRLTSTDPVSLSSDASVGQVWYQRPDDGNARVRVSFTQRTVGKTTRDEHVDFVLNKGWLTDRNYPKKLEVQRQVLRPGQQLNLLKLGEGPFPLPIGQAKADVYKEFDVKKIPPTKSDPPGTVHVLLTPKPGTALARKFKTIDVWADLKLKMPVRIETLDVNETDDRTTDLTNLKLNPGLKDPDFTLPPIGPDWSQRQEPFAD